MIALRMINGCFRELDGECVLLFFFSLCERLKVMIRSFDLQPKKKCRKIYFDESFVLLKFIENILKERVYGEEGERERNKL